MFEDRNSDQCRLCLKSGDCPIDIFEPKGTNGLLVWKIIKEFTEMETCHSDGLPRTICQDCMKKLTDFKYFKKMCIDSRIEFLKCRINDGLIVPLSLDERGQLRKDHHGQGDVHAGGTRDNLEAMNIKSEICVKAEPVDLDELSPEDNLSSSSDDERNDATSCISDAHNSEFKQVSVKTEESDFDDAPEADLSSNRGNDSSGDDSRDSDAPDSEFEGSDGSCGNIKREPSEGEGESEGHTDETLEEGKGSRGLGEKGKQDSAGIQQGGKTSNSLRMVRRSRPLPHAGEGMVSTEEDSTNWSAASGSQVGEGAPKQAEGAAETGDGNVTTKSGDQIYECDACGSMFSSKIFIIRHVRVHRESGRVRCEVCSLRFRGEAEFERHSSLRHGGKATMRRVERAVVERAVGSKPEGGSPSSAKKGVGKFTCRVCNEGFPKRREMWAHMRTHPPPIHSCDVCGKQFSQKVHLKIHVKGVHLKERNFSCEDCGKAFAHKSALDVHLAGHRGERPHVCRECRKGFASARSLKLHVQAVHEGEKPYVCPVCSKAFSQRVNLESHEALHRGDRPHACDHCPKTFKRADHLKAHVTIHTGLRPHQCPHCPRGFVHANQLRAHVEGHGGNKRFECRVCQKAFALRAVLRTHMLVHSDEKPHRCTACPKRFKSAGYLQRHMLVHEGRTKYHRCPVCSKVFSEKGNLNAHMVVHTDKRPFKCEVCSKAFRLKNTLQNHMVVHTEERPFKCEVCSKAFAHERALKVHAETHVAAPERPFKCEVCSKTFRLKIILRGHMKVHSGVRPHVCTVCSKAFTQKSNLTVHMAMHEGIKRFSCDRCSFASTYKQGLERHLRLTHGCSDEDSE